MSRTGHARRSHAPAPAGSARLLEATSDPTRPVTLARHRDAYDPPSAYAGADDSILASVEASGLRGRGGAAFPTATKIRAVRNGRGRSVVVVNATEGEPASQKDKLLACRVPHLIIDGALLAAGACGASEVILCVERHAPEASVALRSAVHERRMETSPVQVRVEQTPSHFVAGEESALVHWLNGGPAKPTATPPRPFERGVNGRPTLVINAETAAHVTQIVAFGPDWFRTQGTGSHPGTALMSVTGGLAHRWVFEVPHGFALKPLLVRVECDPSNTSAVLVGGYYGAWLTIGEAGTARLDPDSMRAYGAGLGCGAIVALPRSACGIRETARVLSWLASETAGQCGPCVHGLDSIARATSSICTGSANTDTTRWLERWAGQVEGRGACRFPDGAVRLLRSALRVFAADIDDHVRSGGCPHDPTPVLTIPDTAGEPWR